MIRRPALPGGALRVALQDLDVAAGDLVEVLRDLDVDLRRVDLHVDAGHLPQLAQLGVGERGLGGPAAAEQDHLLHLRLAERAERVVGDVGDRELVGVEQQHAGDVGRHVAVADHHRPLRREVERLVDRVRVAVVPGHEPPGGVAARAVLAGDAEPVLVVGPDRVHDRVVALQQLRARDVLAEHDAAEEAEARLGGGLLVHPRDRLDVRVIGRHARAHQPERGRQRVEQVDFEARRQQPVGGIEAGRAGADHRDPHASTLASAEAAFSSSPAAARS